MQNTRGDVTGEVQQHVGETDSKTKQSEDKKGRQAQKVSLEIMLARLLSLRKRPLVLDLYTKTI